MKRVIAAALLVAAAVLAVAVNSSAGKGKGHHPAGKTITVVEHADIDAVTNGDPNNDVVGDILTFGSDGFDAADTHKVGTDQGSCIRIVVGSSWECTSTTFLPWARSPSKARSATRVTRWLRSPAGRARTATLAARWSSNSKIRKGRGSTSSST